MTADDRTLAELLATYCKHDAAKKALTAEQADIRAAVDAKLRAEWKASGTIPTHRLAGVGTAYLGGGGTQVRVIQPQTFADWLAERYPEHVTLVVSIPRKRVDSDEFARILPVLSMLASEMESVAASGAVDVVAAEGALDLEHGRLVSADGEVVEGVAVVDVEPSLTIRPAKK